MQFNKPLFWDSKKISFLSVLFFPLSIIYLVIVKIIRIPYIFKNHDNPQPIICVGNIYLGGTGKTPLAIELFKYLKSIGKKPSFIKKHYDYLLDEIKMLQEIGDTFSAKDRITAIGLSKYNGNDVAILDDGFQDFSIKPNFSILCFNSKQLIGNGFVLPSGPLRESLSAVLRADCIVINGERTKETLEFEKIINAILKRKKLNFFYSKYKIKDIEKLRNSKITAFAGIGNPQNFFDLLKENKLDIKKSFSFPDHYKYSQLDFDKIANDSSTKIVTTKKDYLRLSDKQKEICDYVEIDLEIEKKEELENLIERCL